MTEHDPEATGAAGVGRPQVESYKTWLAARTGRKGRSTPNTIRANLGICPATLQWSPRSDSNRRPAHYE